MGLSVWHLLIVALVIIVLFGRGRIAEMMGDFGKGIKNFKEGMREEDEKPLPPRIDSVDAEGRNPGETPSKSADDRSAGK